MTVRKPPDSYDITIPVVPTKDKENRDQRENGKHTNQRHQHSSYSLYRDDLVIEIAICAKFYWREQMIYPIVIFPVK